jgi:phosphoglycolate phosphatase-like HAD superfamily hydrolase
MSEALHIDGIRAVIFDWNGVLISMDKFIQVDQEFALRYYGRVLTREYILGLVGSSVQDMYDGLTGQPNTSVELAREQLGKINHRTPKQAPEGARETLQFLAQTSLKLGVVTSGKAEIVQHDADEIGILLSWFAFMHTGENIAGDMTAERPIFGQAIGYLTTLGIGPHQTLVVGDEPNNMRDAQAVGAPFVIVPSGLMTLDRILAGGVPPELIIPSLRALPEVLGIEPPIAA